MRSAGAGARERKAKAGADEGTIDRKGPGAGGGNAWLKNDRAAGLRQVAVAHHGDDQAETILHNLTRQRGLKAWAACVR